MQTDLETISNPSYVGDIETLQQDDVRLTMEANFTKQQAMNTELYAQKHVLTDYVTVTVGIGGDYLTIGEAIAGLCADFRGPAFSTSVRPIATIQLLTGFVMAEQVFVKNMDLGWITITAVDSSVTVNRDTLTATAAIDDLLAYPAFFSDNAVLPNISCLFTFDTSGSATSRYAAVLYGPKAQLHISYSSVTNRGFRGGVSVANGMSGIFLISGAKLFSRGATAVISFFNINVRCEGGEADIFRATLNGSTTISVYVQYGGIAKVFAADCSSSGTGIDVQYGGTVYAYGSSGTLSQTANVPTAHGIIYK